MKGEAKALLYAIGVTDAGIELTVFEGGQGSSVALSPEQARQCAQLLLSEADRGENGHG